MRQAFSFIFICIASCIFGIGAAWIALEGELKFDRINLGQWKIWPTAGEISANPYIKAYLARKGTLWMGVSEGLMFVADKDTDHATFNSRCDYILEGKIPRGRLWTLTAQTTARDVDNPDLSVSYITSADAVWEEDGQLIVTVSRGARPGNWLEVGNEGDFRLVLRIYDTPLTNGALDAAIQTPVIAKKDCT